MAKEKLGKRIKKFREMNEISCEELSSRTGLSQEFLYALEEEDVYPSLGPLLKIARAMDIRLGTFLDDVDCADPLIVKYNEREEELSMLKGKGKSPDLRYFSLGKGKVDRHMEPFFITIMPGSAEEKKLTSHEGEEFIIVVSGEVELIYGQETHILKAGDSMYYNSIIPHHVGCASNSTAEIYAVLYIPE